VAAAAAAARADAAATLPENAGKEELDKPLRMPYTSPGTCGSLACLLVFSHSGWLFFLFLTTCEETERENDVSRKKSRMGKLQQVEGQKRRSKKKARKTGEIRGCKQKVSKRKTEQKEAAREAKKKKLWGGKKKKKEDENDKAVR
jgi:hypothetical protein